MPIGMKCMHMLKNSQSNASTIVCGRAKCRIRWSNSAKRPIEQNTTIERLQHEISLSVTASPPIPKAAPPPPPSAKAGSPGLNAGVPPGIPGAPAWDQAIRDSLAATQARLRLSPETQASPQTFRIRDPSPTSTDRDLGREALIRSAARPEGVTVPNWPRINRLPGWKSALSRSLVAASVHPTVGKKEAAWDNETEVLTFNELASSGEPRFEHLGALLATALIKILPKAAWLEGDA